MSYSSDNTKRHLEEHVGKNIHGKFDENLCLLCIQCFEVMITTQYISVNYLLSLCKGCSL